MRETVRTAAPLAERVPMMVLAAILPLTGICATNVTGNIVLTADADWRGLGPVVLDQGATINVNEHTLKVDGLAIRSATGPDVTSSSGVVTSSEIFSGSAAFLFDDNFTYSGNYAEHDNPAKNHRLCVQSVNDSNPVSITYDFGEGNEKRLRAYKMYYNAQISSDVAPNTRAPKNWTFSGSNDNANWTVLDVRTDETEWKKPDARTFSFSNRNAYRYYRLRVSAVVSGGTLELYQLEYFVGEAGYVVPSDLTVPDPSRVSSSALAGGSATNLFDNNFTHSMSHRLLANTFPCDVFYDFGEGSETVLNGYKIYYKANDASLGNGRAPFNWRFEGSSDNVFWTPLDIHEGETNWTSGAAREFWCANGSPWRYYRLHVTKVGHAGYLELFQLEYFCRPAICSPVKLEDIDLTEPGSDYVSNSSTGLTGGSVAALFDNVFSRSEAHRLLLHNNQLPFNIIYDFGDGTNANITSYKIYYNYSAGGRWPQLWTFAGSNTGGTSENEWTILDSREETTAWPNSATNTFSFHNPDNYRYYRMQLKKPTTDANSYLEIYQLEFFHDQQIGTLQVDVPAGTVQTNDCIALDGALRLVKDGAGSFTAAFPDQTYRGGTVISNGTLAAGLAGDVAPLGKPNGTVDDASAVTVCAGGTFDASGLGGWWNYPFLLDGGTLRCVMAEIAAPADTFRHIALAADSRLDVAGGFVMGDGTGTNGCLNLGGHVLTASVSSNGLWTLDLPSVTAGMIAFDLKKADAPIGKKVMAWDENAPSSDVRFAKAASGDRGITVMADGVYVIPNGTLLIFR